MEHPEERNIGMASSYGCIRMRFSRRNTVYDTVGTAPASCYDQPLSANEQVGSSASNNSCADATKARKLATLTAGWSSLVARQAHNLKVVGSNPTPATTSIP